MSKLDQKVGLGIDFTAFDADLKKVADRIESAGKAASVKAGGAAAGLASKVAPQADAGQIGSAVASVGTRLSLGIAQGVRDAGATMSGFVARITTMLDRLVGSAVTIFRRIDAAMKFPAFDAFFKTAQLRLTNFTRIWKKPISDLDLALGGAFGGTVQRLAGVFKALFDGLAAAIAGALKEAVASVAAEFAKLSAGAGQAEAAVDGLMHAAQKTAAVGPKFPKFAPQGAPGTAARPFPGSGRRLGGATDFAAPAPKIPPPPEARWKAFARDVGVDLAVAFRAAGDTAVGFGAILAKVGAALVSVPLRGYVGFARLSNFLSSLGDVGKASYAKLYKDNGVFLGSVLATTKTVMGLSKALLNVGTLGVFRKTAGEAKTSAAQVTGFMRGAGGQVAAAFGFAGLAYSAGSFFKAGVKGASDLNETASRSKVVFGDAFGPVEKQAKAMAQAFGLSRQSQLDVAAGFGAMAQGAGYSEAASASLANQMTKMAADLSSSVNIPFEEAGAKIRSALAGQSEPLRQFGVLIDEDAVKAYALAHGLATSKDAISNQAKVAARAALVMQGLGYAQGDLERTAGSAANQFRKAGGGLEEFGVRVGELLLPAVQAGTEAFNTLLGATLDLFEASLPTIQSWTAAVSAAMERVGRLARNLGAYWQIAQLRTGEFVINTIAWIETIPANFGPMTAWLGRNWSNLLVDLATGTQAVFTNIGANAANFGSALWDALKGEPWEFVWTPLLDGFKATTEKLPDLIKPALLSVDDEVKRLYAGIDAKEKARQQALAQAGKPGPKPPGPVADGKKGKPAEYRLASAVEIGSKEAYSIIAKTLASGKAKDPAREGVVVAKQQLQKQQEIVNTLKAAKSFPLAVK